jgi:hypothetical protein
VRAIVRPHPEEPAAGGVSKDEVVNTVLAAGWCPRSLWFETRRFAPLLTMRDL